MITPSTLPLAGIRVLDLTSILFGPYATQVLGDLGADVIKVEAPAGDTIRAVGPSRTPGMAVAFLGCNRNKRSVVLDLKRAPARDALWRLVDGADVFVHNVRPQKMAALGFDADAVLARKRDIVYGALHGYLEEGPYAGRPAYDDVIQAQCGIAGAFQARDGEPALMPSVVADKSAALMASTGLTAALVQRLRTGKGVYMEIGMFEAMVAYTLVEHQFAATYADGGGAFGYPRVLSPERRPHRTRDGYVCMLAYTDKQWRAFWMLAGQPALAEDPRFATMTARTENTDALYAAAGAALAVRTTEEWLTLLAGAEIPAGPVNTLEQVRSDAHLNAIGFFRPLSHPSEGELETPDAALRFDRGALPVRRPQPRLGEHTREVLAEAGLSGAEIDALADAPASTATETSP